MSPRLTCEACYQGHRATLSKDHHIEPGTASPKATTSREAIEELIAERRKDKEFQARLRKMIEEDRELLDRLAR